MKKKIFLLTALLCLALTSLAQDYTNEELQDKKRTNSTPSKVEKIRLIYSLSNYGYENENAISLITAAQILKRWKYRLPDLTADTLLAYAKKYANGDRDLLSQIKKTEKGTFYQDNSCQEIIGKVTINHGAVGEQKYSLDMINANSTDTYKIKFKENQKAIVRVNGVGLTDLDLYIYDNNGNLISSDTSDSDNCECAWVPQWTGEFTIRIKNRGNMYNLYYMQTN